MGALHAARHVDGDGHRQPPSDAHTPISLSVGAGIIERVHACRVVAHADDDGQAMRSA
jgi:hypothetical protein